MNDPGSDTIMDPGQRPALASTPQYLPATPAETLPWSEIFGGAPVALAVNDVASDRIVYATPEYARQHGYEPHDVIGRHVAEMYVESERSALSAHVRQANEARVHRFESTHRRRDGSTFAAHVEARLVVDPAGRFRYRVVTVQDLTDRRRAEAIQAQLAAIVSCSPDGVVSQSLDGVILTWNASMERILGYPSHEVVGAPASMLAPPDRVDEPVRILARVAAGETVAVETARVRKDGSMVDVLVTAFPVRDRNDAVMSAALIVKDISAQRAAARHLAESERLLRETQQIARVGSWGWDVAADSLLWSDTLCDIYGLPAGGSPPTFDEYLAMVHEDDRRLARSIAEHAFSTGEPFSFEHRIVRPDGDVRHLQAHGRVIRDMEGRVTRMFGSSQDVTEQKLAQAERERLLASESAARAEAERAERRVAFLAEASARLAEAARSAHDTLGVVARLAVPSIADWSFVEMLQPDGSIRQTSICHQDPAQVQMAFDVLARYPIAPDAPGGTGAVIRTGIAELTPDLPPELLDLLAEDGTHREALRRAGFVSALIVPLRVRGEVVGALSLAQAESGRRFNTGDLSLMEEVARRASVALENAHLYEAEREARHQAEAANRSKSEFLAVMSHELRTPLNAIGGYTELLELGVRGPINDAQRDDLLRIQRSQRHLLGLIDEVLSYARLETGAVRFDIRDVALDAALHAVESMVSPQAQAKGLVLRVRCEDGLVVRADLERLRQVLLNLCSNAVKFTDQGGRVEVDARALDGTVAIRVSDTGIGIPADKLEAIFEPFVQVDTSLTRRHEGTGLGLAISRDLARGMGGGLEVRSEVGAGSTFVLTLPAAG